MSYTKTVWETGDTITSAGLNNLEQGTYDNSFIPEVAGTVDDQNAVTIDPNKFYVFGEVSELDISFTAGAVGEVNEYHFRFTSGATPTVLSLPLDVEMPTGFIVTANTIYEISIIDLYGVYATWEVVGVE